MVSIGSNFMRRLTKKELIEAIDRTFPSDSYVGDEYVIAVAIETTVNYNDPVKQSIQFGKDLIF